MGNEQTAGKTDKTEAKDLDMAEVEKLFSGQPSRPGYYKYEVRDRKTNKVIAKSTSVIPAPCCHGGESISKGGFRGGGQDIPAGHQPGYGGHASQPQQAGSMNPHFTVKVEMPETLNVNIVGQPEEETAPEEKKSGWDKFLKYGFIVLGLIALILAGMRFSEWISSEPEPVPTQNEDQTPAVDPGPSITSYVDPDQHNQEQTGNEEGVQSTDDEEEKPQETKVSEKELEDALITLMRDKNNFQLLPNKLAGEDKFIMLASIVTTPYEFSREELQRRALAMKTGETLVVDPKDIATKARNYARFVNWSVLGKDATSEQSPHWWANAYISEVPSSDKTAFSKQVMRNRDVLKRILKDKGTSVDKLLADA